MEAKKLGKWVAETLQAVRDSGLEGKALASVEVLFEYASIAIAMDRCMPGGELGDVKVNRVSIKGSPRDARKTMLVIAGVQKRLPVVTFHTGMTGIDVFHTFMQRHWQNAVKWKPDTPLHAVDPGDEVESLPALPAG